jgi:hypothetical protein
MQSATLAMGTAQRQSRTSVAETCRARSGNRAARHRPATAKAQLKRRLQCYIPALTENDCLSPRYTHTKINRQHLRSLRPALLAGLLATSRNTVLGWLATSHELQFTSHDRSNRPTPRLENAISRRKQTLGTLSNRHFLQVSASHQRRTADAIHPQHSVSNRQSQILEISKNPTKTAFSAVLIDTKNAFPTSPTRPRNKGSRIMHHESRPAAQQSPFAVHGSRAPGRDSRRLPQANSARGALCSAPTRPTSISACA